MEAEEERNGFGVPVSSGGPVKTVGRLHSVMVTPTMVERMDQPSPRVGVAW